MGILGVIGFCITLPKQLEMKIITQSEMIWKFIDLIFIVIPPMLPAAMTVGIVVSLNSLRS
jgi:magnesium-transporting ATPase (P-type)